MPLNEHIADAVARATANPGKVAETTPDPTVSGLSAIALKPGDNVLVTVNRELSRAEASDLAEQLRGRFPNVAFTVMANVVFVAVDAGGRQA